MAIKKNELYSSLWASCDKLRGGMDASQYKDYILTLLFVKYVTDKFKGVKYADITVPEGGSFDDLVAWKGKKNIGEEMDKAIAKLAEANDLRGVIDNAHFNDEAKLGSGKEMVDKLTGLIAIFQRPEFNFANNKAGGDDILGDAYEYLMRNFATESGKSKGQFYTPAEVSRILAKVIGIDQIEERDEGYSVYDPACGSGSLLIRAADEAPFDVSIWGQEKEVTTAGLAKMNLVLHPVFMGFLLNTPEVVQQKSQKAQGDAVVHISTASLKAIEVYLPEYEEQARIAAVLSNIDELTVQIEALLAKKKAIKQGAMQELLTGKKRLSGFKEAWIKIKIGSMAEVYSGGTPNTSEPAFWGGKIPWMNSGELNLKIVRHVQEDVSRTKCQI